MKEDISSMYFIKFPVAGTNIFPHANSVYGGQNLTEYNLRAREMVGTDPSIKYEVGPSYAHSADDFEIRIQQDDTGYVVTQTVLEVLPGRAVINGHYFQTLTPVLVDMVEANAQLKLERKEPLKGELEVGIRCFYSTEPTLAGTLLVENEDHMYIGVQLVVMPKGELITPSDSPTDRNKVNCHLKLGYFIYLDSTIKSVTNYYREKCTYIHGERVSGVDDLLSDQFLRKSKLNPKRLYTFSGKGTDPESGYDTWCDSTDSLIVWDKNPQRTTTKPTTTQAQFDIDLNGKVRLVMPHKQVDGMVTANNQKEYYASRGITLPVASYEENTSGTVDKNYTKHIKEINNKFNLFHQTVKGKQVGYLDVKDDSDSSKSLPPINQAWSVGDYILANLDYTVNDSTDGVRAPSTIYVVIPGLVDTIKFHKKVSNSTKIPSTLAGMELGRVELDSRDDAPNTDDPELYPTFYTVDDGVRGTAGADYFVAYHQTSEKAYDMYYYVVEKTGKKDYSSALFITGEIPLAQDDVIGGFLNASPDMLDNGYVYRDENGLLRLLDYSLLRTGVLAYQLGEDVYIESGLTTEEVQSQLNELVNDRVAFPSAEHMEHASNSNIIDVDIYLPEEEEACELNIHNIDSRFNTAVRINILGEANKHTTINFINCQKLIISNNISGTPIINVYRSSLYYDPEMFNYIRTCGRPASGFTGFQDLKIWYEMLEDTDSNLVVDGMTVSELDAPIITEEADFWNTVVLNDHHFKYALHSITFAGDGTIIRCGLLVSNETTSNIESGHHVMACTFELPQGSGLIYPQSCVTKQLKVTGSFVTAYKSDVWIITTTNFSALSNTYDKYNMSDALKGYISFHSDTIYTSNVDIDEESTCIPGWEPDTYHLFQGGVLC